MSKIYAEDVVRIAAGEVGYLEKASNKDLDSQTGNPGKGNWTKYARDLFAATPSYYNGNKNGYDWCTAFVDWCVYMAADQDSAAAQAAMCYTGPYGASCTLSVNYYKAAGRFWARKTASPKPGDQIFFGSDTNIRHTGLVERITDGVVYTIEGNSGNAVRRRSYSLESGDIYGYGRPRYDGDKAPAETVPEEPVKLPTHFNDVPADTWYTKAVIWAVDNGIVKGVDDTHFAPNEPCTRAQAVTLLYRYHLSQDKGGG